MLLSSMTIDVPMSVTGKEYFVTLVCVSMHVTGRECNIIVYVSMCLEGKEYFVIYACNRHRVLCNIIVNASQD